MKQMISFILLTSAAAFNAAMDMNFNMFDSSIFSKFTSTFWNPNESWRFKWKNGDRNQGEKFPGSSTIFVWVTDSWHLFKAIFLLLVVLTVLTHSNVFDWYISLPLYGLLWFLVFEGTLGLLKRKN